MAAYGWLTDRALIADRKRTPDASDWRHRSDFEAPATEGRPRFHEWIGDSWVVLSRIRGDFTPVCTTERGGAEAAYRGAR
jgi:hypothetical protein